MPNLRRRKSRRKKNLKRLLIYIFGHPINIAMMDDTFSSLGDASGMFVPDENKIYLRQGMPVSQMKETLIHEIIEAINYFADLKMPHNSIQLLALGIHQIDFAQSLK